MLNFIFSFDTSLSPPKPASGSLQLALKVIVMSDPHGKALIAAPFIWGVHAPTLGTSVVTRALVTTTPTPKLFESRMVRVLSSLLATTIVFLLQLISAPKLHLSGSNFEGFSTPKYANALIIIRITRKAHP